MLAIHQRTDNQDIQGAQKLNSPQINKPVKKWATEVNRTFLIIIPCLSNIFFHSVHRIPSCAGKYPVYTATFVEDALFSPSYDFGGFVKIKRK
jgi:hypothetical protein